MLAGLKLVHLVGSKKGVTVLGGAYFNNVNTLCKNFINNKYVKSCLITGRQWDSVMRFVNGGVSGTGVTYNVTQAVDNRHTGSKALSGANPADCVKNIYDLEGNMMEVTSEMLTGNSGARQVQRGGRWGSKNQASYRVDYNESDTAMGCRIALYVIASD